MPRLLCTDELCQANTTLLDTKNQRLQCSDICVGYIVDGFYQSPDSPLGSHTNDIHQHDMAEMHVVNKVYLIQIDKGMQGIGHY